MEKGIVVASFGTTFKEAEELCIRSIEKRVKKEFNGYYTERAFTSQMVINKLKKRDGISVNNVTEALEKMKNEGISQIYIQSLHIIPGHEYNKLVNQAELFKKENQDIIVKIGVPLLYDDTDYERTVNSIEIPQLKPDGALVFMGHGTDHSSDTSYSLLEKYFRKKYSDNIFIGTMEGSITLDDIIPQLFQRSIRKVILMPFMLVTGDHVTNDMAGDKSSSWKNTLIKGGFEVEVNMLGLGQNKKIQDIFISHLKTILENN